MKLNEEYQQNFQKTKERLRESPNERQFEFRYCGHFLSAFNVFREFEIMSLINLSTLLEWIPRISCIISVSKLLSFECIMHTCYLIQIHILKSKLLCMYASSHLLPWFNSLCVNNMYILHIYFSTVRITSLVSLTLFASGWRKLQTWSTQSKCSLVCLTSRLRALTPLLYDTKPLLTTAGRRTMTFWIIAKERFVSNLYILFHL